MLKFINSLGTIEVNKDIEAIQLTFTGSGTTHHYFETLRMASSFANLHSINTYLLIKNEFIDVNCQQFYDMVENWLHWLDQNFNRKYSHKSKVALLINHTPFIELSNIIHESHRKSQDYFHVLLDLFCDKEKAYHFLDSLSVNKTIRVYE